MQENSFLPSEEPQEQHQGEGAQGILWRNLLSSISQLFIVRSSWNLVGISHSRLSTSFVKETFLSNHQGILENNIQVTLDKEHLRKNFFLCKSIIDNNNIGDLFVRKFIPRSIRRNLCTKKSISTNIGRHVYQVFFRRFIGILWFCFLNFWLQYSKYWQLW